MLRWLSSHCRPWHDRCIAASASPWPHAVASCSYARSFHWTVLSSIRIAFVCLFAIAVSNNEQPNGYAIMKWGCRSLIGEHHGGLCQDQGSCLDRSRCRDASASDEKRTKRHALSVSCARRRSSLACGDH